GTCNAGFGDCDLNGSTGCETNTRISPANCGSCGVVCPARANATTSCAAGTCGFICNAGFADCNAVATDGCETDIRTSPVNCGGCGMACSFANASATCMAGACAIGTCNAGFGNCDGLSANGCETNTLASASNCGTCGT